MSDHRAEMDRLIDRLDKVTRAEGVRSFWIGCLLGWVAGAVLGILAALSR